MKNHHCIALALAMLVFAPKGVAQTKTERASVEWGPEMVANKEGDFSDVVAYTDEHIYMTTFLKKEIFLRKMGLNYSTVYQKLIPLTIDKEDHGLEDIAVFGDRILIFTSHFDKKEKKRTLYLRVFNESDMTPQGRPQELASMDVEKRSNSGGFDIRTSPDEKVILVSQMLPFEKEGYERFSLSVYDHEMTPMWDRKVDLPYLDSEFGVESMRVANDGSVIMIGNKYAEKREAKDLRKDGKATYEYHLLVYHGDGQDPEDHPIVVPGKFLQDLTLNIGSEGDVLCGGFYGNAGEFATSGTFFLRIDRATKAIVHSSYKEFDRDFITQYMTEKEEKKATKKAEKKGAEVEMFNYELRDIVRRDDGGAVMIGEQYRFYITTVTTTDANGRTSTRTVYNYVYNDIIVVNIDEEGNIEWAAKVPKRQHSTNDGGRFSSYAMTVKDDKIYLMFNDAGANLFLKPGDPIAPFRYGKDMLITLATVDSDGTVHREALLNVEKRDFITRPKDCVQLQDDRLFIFASWKKEQRFGAVTFE
jgi:hypothetical protein